MAPTPRERLLASAVKLVQRNGVAGTGIAELVEHSKTARGSLYSSFPGGKSELIETAVYAVGAFTCGRISATAENNDARGWLRDYIETWKQLLLDNDFETGCPVAAAAVAADVPGATAAAGSVFESWIALIAAHLETQGVVTEKANALATLTFSAIEGALILCRAQRATEALDKARNALDDLYRTYLGE